MQKSTPPHKHHSAFWITLLAIVCVAGAELSASYFFAPVFFKRVTDPVCRSARAAVSFVADTADSIGRQLEDTAAAAAAYLTELTTKKDTAGEQDRQIADGTLCSPKQLYADPSVTELQSAGGREFLSGGTQLVEYFQQSSPVWADEPYGTDDIGQYGCGPVTMAMVVSSLTETRVTPTEMAAWSVKNGQWAKHGGSYLSIVEEASAAFGLHAVSISEKTPEAIQNALFSGNLVVAIMGPGHFTKGGHFILIRGVTLEGNLLVADPNSLDRSLMEWDPQLILDELSASTQDGAPLWVIGAD